jgi:hypothetical protein
MRDKPTLLIFMCMCLVLGSTVNPVLAGRLDDFESSANQKK